MTTEMFVPQYKEPKAKRCNTRSSSLNKLHYTFSFHRSELAIPNGAPPPYPSTRDISCTQDYSFSPSQIRPRSTSYTINPLRPTQPWTSPPNAAVKRRPSSTLLPLVSPMTSPTSDFDSLPMTYQTYRPSVGSTFLSQAHPSPTELPSPFDSPMFYWFGQSNQRSTTFERDHQAQADDLSLMSPFGSPAFYWDGNSRPTRPEKSTLDRARKAWKRIGSRRAASRVAKRNGDVEWNEKKGAWFKA